jgi:DNA primase
MFTTKDVIADPEFGYHCQAKIQEEKRRKIEFQKLIGVNYLDLSGTSTNDKNVIEF